MKTAFVLACVLAATVEASVLDTIQAKWDAFPVTRADALAKHGKSKAFKTSPEHKRIVDEAHVNVRASRERLGLAPFGGVGVGSRGEDIRKSYEDMTGFSARILGTFAGLQYNAAAGPNKCFGAVESGLTASSNLFYVLTKVYLPWYVPEAQLIVQDNIALLGGFYTDCEANKFFDSMTALFSEEGLSALGARAVTAQQFEIKRYNKMKSDPSTTSFQRGEAFGKAFGAVTAYHI
jgi:hypothetical protein